MKVSFDEAQMLLAKVWMDLNEKSDGRALVIVAIDEYDGGAPFYVTRMKGDKVLIAEVMRAVLKQMERRKEA